MVRNLLVITVVVLLGTALASTQVTFTDVTDTAGIGIRTGGGRANWGDYNSDGWLDLFCVGSPTNFLFRNDGDGTFTDVTAEAGVESTGYHGAAWGDYNNDGYLDLYQAGWGVDGLLYHNNGDGTFTNLAAEAGVTGSVHDEAPAWVDYDRDGDLDLYIAAYDISQFGGKPDALYQNNGDGTFTNVAGTAIPLDYRCGRSLAWADYDNDGLIDVYVGNYRLQNNFLYHNNGPPNWDFADLAADAGVAGAEHTLGVAWGDYDNDGDLDLFTATVHGSSILYRNNGDGTFTNVTAEAGVYGAYDGCGATWGDYDNDGYLDLVTAGVYAGTVVFLYRNNGDGTFTNLASAAGVAYGGWSQAWTDYNNDGWLDLYCNAGPAGRSNTLYRNNGGTNHWIEIILIGVDCNRAAIGTRVRAVAGDLSQIREIGGGLGMSQDMMRAHFGLGSYTQVDTLEVRWPCGRVERAVGLPADRFICLVEGPPGPPENLKANPGPDGAALSWSTNPEADIWAYNVYRGVQPGGPYDSLASVLAPETTYTDTTIEPGTAYYYVVTALDVCTPPNESPYSNEAYFLGVEELDSISESAFTLAQNFPNPFTRVTTIYYALPGNSKASLKIYDCSGRLVRSMTIEAQKYGVGSVEWDGMTDQGRRAGPGGYFYSLTDRNGLRSVRKMVLLP